MYNYLKIFLILITISFHKSVYAVEDGIYIGVWKITYSHADSDNNKGDSGIFEFTIKDNKVIKLYTPDVPNWDLYKLKYSFNINKETNELTKYASGYDPSHGVRFKINMKGIFIDKKFAGSGNFQLTSPDNFILDKFIFESIN